MELKEEFEQAVANSKNLPAKPDNETLLKLYSLYKQSIEGDVNTEPPSGFDFVGQAKYNAWSALKGKSKETAMNEYISLVKSLGS